MTESAGGSAAGSGARCTDFAAEDSLEGGDAAYYNQKAKQGLKLMVSRQVLIQIFTFAGGIVLARTLTPEIFGIFGISMFLVNTLALFGNFGLAPSLVQRKNEFTERDLQVAFTLQQGLLTAVAAAIWSVAPYFLRIYPDIGGPEMVWLIRMMAVTLFLQSWRSMSVLQMERHLNFKKVAGIEIVEALSYQGLAVVLALFGFGVWSLVWATLTRGLLGTALAFAASPWRVRLAWDAPKAKQLLRFGIPFQAGALANKAGSWVTPVFVGSMIGPGAVGFLTWASANGHKPATFMHSIIRVAFPHFARLQDDPVALARSFERYVLPPLIFAAIWTSTILVAGHDLTALIYGDHWLPAVLALQLFAAKLLPTLAEWIGGCILRATGRVNIYTVCTGVRTGATVALALILVPTFGFVGVAMGTLAVHALVAGFVLMRLPIAWSEINARIVLCPLAALAAGVCAGMSVPDSSSLFIQAFTSAAASTVAAFAAACCTAPTWLTTQARDAALRMYVSVFSKPNVLREST